MYLTRFLTVLLWFSFLVGTQLQANEGSSFAYVDDSQAAPPPRFRSLETGLPGGLSQQELLGVVDPQAQSSWQFGWFTYGESNSRSVGVGLRGGSDPQLYVDTDRDKQFSESERFERDTELGTWVVPVGAEFVTEFNDYAHVERSIMIRPSKRGGFLELATRGVMKGVVDANGKTMAAVRIDRNSNGRWFDSGDRILLDVNGDGKVDSIAGRISCDSLCQIDGKRFVIQGDALGERLALVELAGTGKIVPQIQFNSENAVLGELSGTLVSRDGVRARIRGHDQSIDCPVGQYRIESLTFDVTDNDRSYWFRFSTLDSADHPIVVSEDQIVKVDLLGQVTLNHQLVSVPLRRSTTMIVTPLLKTSTGLYLSGGKSGESRPNLENRLLMTSTFEGEVFARTSTGFS